MGRHRASDADSSDFDAATAALTDVTGDYVVDAASHPHRHPGATRDGHHRARLVPRPRGGGAPRRRPARDQPGRAADRDRDGRHGPARPGRAPALTGFLDVERYPAIVFASTAVEQVDDDVYRVTGDLTIRDVTRPVTVDFALTGSALDPFGNSRVGFEGALAIRRSEWGLTWNTPLDTGGVLVSDRIQIEFDVSAIRTT